MFVRWKAGRSWRSAFLIKSVRKNGKPRGEVLGKLCSARIEDEQFARPWAEAELNMIALGLDSAEQAHIRELLLQQMPRPSEEKIEQAKREVVQDAALLARMVPDIPPIIGKADTTEGDSPYFITWKVEQPRPKFGVPARYTAFLAKRGTVNGKSIVQIVTRLHLKAMNELDLQGISKLRNGTTIVSHNWRTFWYQVHCALILTQIDESTYQSIMHRLDTWVKRPTQEELIDFIQDHLYWDNWLLQNKMRELERGMERCLKHSDELRTVLSHSSSYLGGNPIVPKNSRY